MSPTEDDLRRALSDGAGDDVPDTTRILAIARERRGRRRRTLLSAAAAVIVVGGVAAGVAALHGRGDDTPAANIAGSNGEPATVPTLSPRAADGSPASGVACPRSTGHPLLPGGGGSGQFGSGDRLFAKAVKTVTVCVYLEQAVANPTPTRLNFSGGAAASIATSLENASRRQPSGLCEQFRRADQQTLVILATAADGSALKPVTTANNEPTCAVTVTNGTAIRYAWTPPAFLARQLAQYTDTPGSLAPVPQPPTVRNGSPPNK